MTTESGNRDLPDYIPMGRARAVRTVIYGAWSRADLRLHDEAEVGHVTVAGPNGVSRWTISRPFGFPVWSEDDWVICDTDDYSRVPEIRDCAGRVQRCLDELLAARGLIEYIRWTEGSYLDTSYRGGPDRGLSVEEAICSAIRDGKRASSYHDYMAGIASRKESKILDHLSEVPLEWYESLSIGNFDPHLRVLGGCRGLPLETVLGNPLAVLPLGERPCRPFRIICGGQALGHFVSQWVRGPRKRPPPIVGASSPRDEETQTDAVGD